MDTQTERDKRNGIEMNLGKEVVINCSSGEFLGRVNRIDSGNYELYLLPSMVWESDGKQGRVERVIPTTVSLANFEKGRIYSIRPMRDGYIEEMAKLSQRGSSVGFVPGERKTE